MTRVGIFHHERFTLSEEKVCLRSTCDRKNFLNLIKAISDELCRLHCTPIQSLSLDTCSLKCYKMLTLNDRKSYAFCIFFIRMSCNDTKTSLYSLLCLFIIPYIFMTQWTFVSSNITYDSVKYTLKLRVKVGRICQKQKVE